MNDPIISLQQSRLVPITERHVNTSHCWKRDVFLSSQVGMSSSVAVSVCALRVCVCVIISACPQMCAFLSHLPGGALLTVKAAQLSSLRLGQPLGQSGLLGNPRWSNIRAGMQKEKRR